MRDWFPRSIAMAAIAAAGSAVGSMCITPALAEAPSQLGVAAYITPPVVIASIGIGIASWSGECNGIVALHPAKSIQE